MKTLQVEGIRCFRDEQKLPLKPITLLVGENSTGKSTALAMIRAAWDVAFRPTHSDFNEEPFGLGSYNAIAHYHGGQAKRAHRFTIGGEVEVELPGGTTRRSFTGTFIDRAGQPTLSAWNVWQAGLEISVQLADDHILLDARENNETIFERERINLQPAAAAAFDWTFLVMQRFFNIAESPGSNRVDIDKVMQVLPFTGPAIPRPIPTAPIRSKAERTYDPRKDSREPGGGHVPMQLATMHATDRKEFESLSKGISAYGSAAGLFANINVKRLGRQSGDPFQVLVTVDKHPFNLTDVGYGVGQVLPILFDTLAAPAGQTFLLQQPEVHLHPRAQAELGTMLVTQAASRQQRFVVETHSDHLVDRVRMELREKRNNTHFSHEDVVILYFERSNGRATVHPIRLNSAGDLIDPPRGYRDFFLSEERRLLGISHVPNN